MALPIRLSNKGFMKHYLVCSHNIPPPVAEVDCEVCQWLIKQQTYLTRLLCRLECKEKCQKEIQNNNSQIQAGDN